MIRGTEFPTISFSIQPQPAFPVEDLHDDNVPWARYYLTETPASGAFAEAAGEHLRLVHLAAHNSLVGLKRKLGYTPEEYGSFCAGYAAFDLISNLVNPQFQARYFPTDKVTQAFLDPESTELFLGARHELWQTIYPNIDRVMLGVGLQQRETDAQLHTRTIGAHVAWELQSTNL